MIRYAALFLLFALVAFGFSSQNSTDPSSPENWNEDSPVWMVLKGLGAELPSHYPQNPSEEMLQAGYDFVHIGNATDPATGKKAGQQSKYFVCTDCHNASREDPDLRLSNPESRLAYSLENNIPFLQGTTFFGIVNRETWYNDDYAVKYGEAVEKSRNNIREAIQLCSIQCSQGRYLKEWEIDAILQYYWSLQYKMSDLGLSDSDWGRLKENSPAAIDVNLEKRNFLKSFYLQKSPATFGEPPSDFKAGYGIQGDAERGKLIYESSCLHCHDQDGPSFYLKLDEKGLSRGFLKSKIKSRSRFSIYKITREGTHSFAGHKPYMPNYTKERLSDQQIEDLRAYIENK